MTFMYSVEESVLLTKVDVLAVCLKLHLETKLSPTNLLITNSHIK